MGTQKTGTGLSAEFVDAQNVGLVDGILSGQIIAQAIPALSVQTVSLAVIRGNLKESIPDQSLAIGAPPGLGLVRCDMVQWNGTTINVKAGAPAAINLANAPTPDPGFIPLALTMVFNGDTTVRNMGLLDSLSVSKGRIYAYYFAKRGLFAASQAGQDAPGAVTDPEVALPLYHPRSGVIRIKAAGSVIPTGAPLGGVQGVIVLDGTNITRSAVKQQYNNAPNTGEAGVNQDTVVGEMPRAGVPSGVHRWTIQWTFRSAGETLSYRLMELEEIL